MERDIVYLECTEGVSNKFYNLEIFQKGPKWFVEAHWGRIGSKGREDVLLNTGKAELANQFRQSKIRSKIKRGYKDITVRKKEEQSRENRKEQWENSSEVKKLSLKRFSDILE